VNDSTPLPDSVVELVAERFRVLSEPARIRLLDALRTSGPASVGELGARLGLNQQNTSKHLGVLATAGLVGRTRAGNSVVYAISDPTVFTLCEVVCDALRDRVAALQAALPPAPSPR
jgi:DNA-binding transcriptional ArsR family regulator